MGGRGLEGGIVNDLVEEVAEIEVHCFGVRRSSLETFEQEKLTDEVVEPAGLALDAIEGLGGPGAFAIAGELEGHRQPCQRRTQLVRDVPKEAPLGTNQVFEATRHGVEVTGELSDLVPPTIDGIADPRREVAGAETQGRPTQRSDRRRQVAGEPEAEGADNQRQQQEPPPQGLRLQEIGRTRRPVEGSHDDQHPTLGIGHRPRHHVHTTATHGFLGPALRHPARQIDNGFGDVPILELSTL